jgi:hypothetical protein
MQFAFITGMGRSGTKFVASLLNECAGLHAAHESIGHREFWLLSWYLPGAVYARPFLRQAREALEARAAAPLYVDVNGMLQHCVPELRDAFGEAPVFHLVRDPRKVVRSIYIRRNDADTHIVPKEGGALARWLREDKLYQVCWNWADVTGRLLAQDTRLVRFEDVVSDYGLLRRQLLEPLGAELPESRWRRAVQRRVNATRPPWIRRAYSFLRGKPYVNDYLPPFEAWTPQQQQVLLSVCGEAMRRCGYL